MADYVPQIVRNGFLRHTMATCEPASMTLNLNIFDRTVLEKAGGVDEATPQVSTTLFSSCGYGSWAIAWWRSEQPR